MSIETMGDRRRETVSVQGRSVETLGIVVERRINGAGSHDPQAYPCNELIVMVGGTGAGGAVGRGRRRAMPGPGGDGVDGADGFAEKAVLSDPIDCVHLCLPSGLIDRSAEHDFEVDAGKVELAFAGGSSRPLHQRGRAQSVEPVDAATAVRRTGCTSTG